jgi:probable phosphoglycerate mutase
MDTRFLLIRHAESEWNADGRWQGQADPGLSAEGRAQAEALAASLVDARLEVLVASDLDRARETAVRVGRATGLVPILDPRFRELDVGSWSGLRREEIAAQDPALLAGFESGDPDVRPGGGETRREIRLRVRDAAAELREIYAGRRIALVTHLGVIRALWPGTEMANAEARWWEPEETEVAAQREAEPL